MNSAIATLQQQLPLDEVQSFTVDRGEEFATHASITRAIRISLYFADFFAALQRGINENANGFLREFFPKKTNFAMISDAQLTEVLYAINQRPRKCCTGKQHRIHLPTRCRTRIDNPPYQRIKRE